AVIAAAVVTAPVIATPVVAAAVVTAAVVAAVVGPHDGAATRQVVRDGIQGRRGRAEAGPAGRAREHLDQREQHGDDEHDVRTKPHLRYLSRRPTTRLATGRPRIGPAHGETARPPLSLCASQRSGAWTSASWPARAADPDSLADAHVTIVKT